MIVYIIVNKISKSFYVGITNGNRRSYFGSGEALKDAIRSYGRCAFRKFTIEHCENRAHASEREVFWIEKCKAKWPSRKCYNLTSGGENEYTLDATIVKRTSEKLKKFYEERPHLKEFYRNHAKNGLVKYVKEHGNANQKINKSQREQIIAEYINYQKTGTQLASEYGVSPSCIHRIVKPYLKKKYKGSGNGQAKLNEVIVKEIRDRYSENRTLLLREIGAIYGVSYAAILNVLSRKTWNHV